MAFLDDVVEAVRSAACFTLGAYDTAFGWLGGPNPAAGARGALCDNPVPPPPPPPPFSGGQCPGDEYNIDFFEQAGGRVRRYTTNGPIGAASATPGEVLPNGDQPFTFNVSGFSNGGNPENFNQTVTFGASQVPITGPVITNLDNAADDCGDPPPPPPPPYIPEPITEPVPDPDGGPDIDLDITLFAPIVVGPNVFAPVRIEGPTFSFDGRINFNPNFSIEIGMGSGGGSTGGGTEGEGGGTEVPEEPGDIQEDSPDEPEECDGRRILGLHVALSFSGAYRASDVEQDGDIGAIAVPRVGILYFVARMGGSSNLLPGIDLKSRSQYIPVPFGVFVDCWRIHTEDGIEVASVRPVFDSPEVLEV